ncbi:hypothetical protein [Psychromarinibacter sp. S121]|uniref:hypothetical protein n=1 Tax=Psychromarinibacter sp. S121 TaxID=3415127 RepID=UPI003C7E64EF
MNMTDGLNARSAALATLFEKKLKIRGDGLEEKLRHGKRRLPHWVRVEAGKLVAAQQLAAHPKLAAQVDADGLDVAATRCERWARGVDLSQQRRDAALRMVAGIAMNLLIVAGAFIAWLVWSGNL